MKTLCAIKTQTKLDESKFELDQLKDKLNLIEHEVSIIAPSGKKFSWDKNPWECRMIKNIRRARERYQIISSKYNSIDLEKEKEPKKQDEIKPEVLEKLKVGSIFHYCDWSILRKDDIYIITGFTNTLIKCKRLSYFRIKMKSDKELGGYLTTTQHFAPETMQDFTNKEEKKIKKSKIFSTSFFCDEKNKEYKLKEPFTITYDFGN
jgi:hypothetical protein